MIEDPGCLAGEAILVGNFSKLSQSLDKARIKTICMESILVSFKPASVE